MIKNINDFKDVLYKLIKLSCLDQGDVKSREI